MHLLQSPSVSGVIEHTKVMTVDAVSDLLSSIPLGGGSIIQGRVIKESQSRKRWLAGELCPLALTRDEFAEKAVQLEGK